MYPSTDRIAKTDTSAQAYRQPHTRKPRGKHAHIAHINTNERQSTHTHTHTQTLASRPTCTTQPAMKRKPCDLHVPRTAAVCFKQGRTEK